MARKQLGDYTELSDLTQVADRTPKTTDRIPITRGGRNLNMAISTLMAYVNAHLTLEGEGVGETITSINTAIANLQDQLATLTQTDLTELLSQLHVVQDILDRLSETGDLIQELQTLKETILSDVSAGYVSKSEFESLKHVVETSAIGGQPVGIQRFKRMTRSEYQTLKNNSGVKDGVWYIVTDNTDQSVVLEVRVGLTLIAKNDDQGSDAFTYIFPFTFIN